MMRRRISVDEPLDLARTMWPLCRGTGDPTMRIDHGSVIRATRTPDGPATVRIDRTAEGGALAEGWGAGAGWVLDGLPDLLGLNDGLERFHPPDPLVAELTRRFGGARITRSRRVIEALVPAVLEQKVTGLEARRAYRRLATSLGEPAPGGDGLVMPPDPERVAELPYHAFHPFGVERRRAETLRALCARAARLEEIADLPPEPAERRLTTMPGVGAWTAAEVARTALGDPDAVSVGDFHLPHIVSWALAREPRGTDERMLELLEPYRGNRGRVTRLLEVSGIAPPKFGPRFEPRAIERL